MKYTEKQLKRMASPISESEEEKCKNAIKMVRDAMKKIDYSDDGELIRTYAQESYSYALDLHKINSDKKITLLVQGSYANRTNIPSDSDVDVAVILESTFTPKYRTGVNDSNYGFRDATFSASELKDEVESALKQHFGNSCVERHNKCIKVTGNTYRVDADVVPSQRYRDYTNDYRNDANNYISGIQILADSGERILNYPEQHIKNGIEKNKRTGYAFKKCVRIIKNLREDMIENGYSVSSKISSFGLESLLWNVSDSVYNRYSSLGFIFDEALIFLKDNANNFSTYMEINGIKKLFTDTSTQNDYANFVKDLWLFFEYTVKE